MPMPFESSLPFVLVCAACAIAALRVWLRFQRAWILVSATLIAATGIAAFVADRMVVTDRETLLELFPRLARAAEAQDVSTIMAALDPDLQSLRDDAGRILAKVRPRDVVLTKLEITLDPPTHPSNAAADLIARVTGNVIDRGAPGTVVVTAVVTLHKKEGTWLITGAEAGPLKPGSAR
jgi:hypothetical protein